MNEYIEKIGYAVFAGVGGIIFYLLGVVEGRGSTNFRVLIVYGLSSGFIGIITMLICKAYNVDENLTGALTGIAGALGARTTMSIIESILEKYFKIKIYNRRKNDSSR